jgi:hypothetical protein
MNPLRMPVRPGILCAIGLAVAAFFNLCATAADLGTDVAFRSAQVNQLQKEFDAAQAQIKIENWAVATRGTDVIARSEGGRTLVLIRSGKVQLDSAIGAQSILLQAPGEITLTGDQAGQPQPLQEDEFDRAADGMDRDIP